MTFKFNKHIVLFIKYKQSYGASIIDIENKQYKLIQPYNIKIEK